MTTEAEPQGLRALYIASEAKRRKLNDFPFSDTPEYEEVVDSITNIYKSALEALQHFSVFSTNESIEDISTNDLPYLLFNFHFANVILRRVPRTRKNDLLVSQGHLRTFLQQLDSYDLLDKSDTDNFERLKESPSTFSVAASTDPAARRNEKIKRYQAEKELKKKVELLESRLSHSDDDEIARDLYLQQVRLAKHESFQILESISQELHILSLAPAPDEIDASRPTSDLRDRDRASNGYSDKLDGPRHSSAGLSGPLLDPKGRPMRPFTLLDKRQQLQQGVFRPSHNLPTMSIDEYLEEERRRGGIIEGGGPQSGMPPEPDEDNYEKTDAATMKARAWDEFVEENPKGAGNTLNRG